MLVVLGAAAAVAFAVVPLALEEDVESVLAISTLWIQLFPNVCLFRFFLLIT